MEKEKISINVEGHSFILKEYYTQIQRSYNHSGRVSGEFQPIICRFVIVNPLDNNFFFDWLSDPTINYDLTVEFLVVCD